MKKTFYVFSTGVFRRRDNTLYFETEAGERRFIPVEDTAEIMVFGEVEINKRFLEFLSRKEIVLHYFNRDGYYMGTFYPREHLNSGYMTLRQAEHYLNPAKRLLIARRIVEGALRNILRVLKYYRSRGKELTEVIAAIENLNGALEECGDTAALMAVEGNTREYYYRAFDAIIDQHDFVFEARTRRPPQNHLNTLISFGNTLLYTLCLSEIYRTHLDPRIGFLHATNFRRFTLNLDVAEIFKPIIVDRVIFTLLGRRMLTADDFEKGTRGLLLKDRGKRCFVEKLEEKLRTTIQHREIGRSVSYRRLVRLELYKLEKHLMGEKEYIPFVMTW
jgi:CRISPR-associated protein Cas1